MWTLDLNCRTLAFCYSKPFEMISPNIPAVESQLLWESYEPTPGHEKPLPRACHVSVTTEDRIIMFVPLTFTLYLVVIF